MTKRLECLHIENVADHLHLIDTIALWHFREWGQADPTGSVQSWTEGLRQGAERGRVPTTFVALEGDELLGSVTLTEHDMNTHLDHVFRYRIKRH